MKIHPKRFTITVISPTIRIRAYWYIFRPTVVGTWIEVTTVECTTRLFHTVYYLPAYCRANICNCRRQQAFEFRQHHFLVLYALLCHIHGFMYIRLYDPINSRAPVSRIRFKIFGRYFPLVCSQTRLYLKGFCVYYTTRLSTIKIVISLKMIARCLQ